jgi:predicted GIY-YIG superfamily endonuclease
MPSEVHVYELIDPRDGKRFYIGITDNEKRRLGEHTRARCPSTRKVVEDLRASGLRPKMVRLATCPFREVAEELEAAMKHYGKRKPDAAQRWRQGMRMTPPLHGAVWSSSDEQRLRDDRGAGRTVREIATSFQRSSGAITSKLRKMGLALEEETHEGLDQRASRWPKAGSIPPTRPSPASQAAGTARRPA